MRNRHDEDRSIRGVGGWGGGSRGESSERWGRVHEDRERAMRGREQRGEGGRYFDPDEGMESSGWSGASGRGETSGWGGQREHGSGGGHGGYGGRERGRQWGRDREEWDRDFSGREWGRERGGQGGYGGSTGYGGYGGSFGYGGYGGYGGSGGYGGQGGVGGYGARGMGSYGGMGERGPGSMGERYERGRGYGGRTEMGGREGWGREGMGGRGTDMGFGAREEEEERGPHYGKGPKGYRRSDERIREDVSDVIAQQGFIDASDVEVKVDGGVVTLSGQVQRRQDKRSIEQMIERVHGVDEVHNELRLRREERTTQGGREQQQQGNGNRARA